MLLSHHTSLLSPSASASASASASSPPPPSPRPPPPLRPFPPMASIHSLPVELLARVFVLGVCQDPDPDKLQPGDLTFELLVSHVSQYWRDVALRTPQLWTTIHLRTLPHLARARCYLARSIHQPLHIFVDTCTKEDYDSLPGYLLFRDEFLPAFEILTPHIVRWRSLVLKVRDLACKAHARTVLSTCGAAPILDFLQLWHIEDWGTAERLYTAIGPPPVIVFDGSLPALRDISLIGVNLPWSLSPFLEDLHSIELALHSDDVRIPFPYWHRMLLSSPALSRLALTYSGPRAKLGPWALPARIPLPALAALRLTDLDPPYLCALLRSIDAPAVHTLHLELPEQDFSPFVRLLARPLPPLAPAIADAAEIALDATVLPPELEAEPADDAAAAATAAADAGPSRARAPFFPALETLSVAALECTLAGWRRLLAAHPALRVLEADFARMPAGAFGVLLASCALDGGREPGEDEGKGKGTGTDTGGGGGGGAGPLLLLPALETLRVAGVGGAELAALARARRAAGCAIREWRVSSRWQDAACELLAREMEARGGAERLEFYTDEDDEEDEEEVEADDEEEGEEEEFEDDGEGEGAEAGDELNGAQVAGPDESATEHEAQDAESDESDESEAGSPPAHP